MTRSSVASKCGLSLVASSVLMGACAVESSDVKDVEGAQVEEELGEVEEDRTQTPEEALKYDVELTAERLGISADIVEEKFAFQKEFRKQLQGLLDRYPDEIAGAWIDELPSIGGHIRFVGKVPDDVEFVGEWSKDVEFLSDGVMSFRKALEQGELIAFALQDAGYKRLLTYYSVQTNELMVETRSPLGEAPPKDADIVELSRQRFRTESIKAEDVDALSINVVHQIGEGDIVDEMHDYGGARLEWPGGNDLGCTTGFSVTGPDGGGIVTAGHCILGGSNMDYVQPVTATQYTSNLHSYVYNPSGDSMYRTSTHDVFGEFYYSQASKRAQSSEWPGGQFWPLGVGDSTCNYGRATNSAICGQSVNSVNVSRLTDGGVFVGKLARTTNPNMQTGDSGGPFYLVGEAMGVTHGFKSGWGYFTPVYWIEQALGVDIID